jgi:hypothetical protein
VINWYNRKGEVIKDYKEIESLLGNFEYKVVKQSKDDKHAVSTVWIGLDHNYFGGRPLIFETMVFAIKDGKWDMSDLDCERYSTEEEALKGHEAMCRKWLKQTKEDV